MGSVCSGFCKNDEIINLKKKKIDNYTKIEEASEYYKLLGNQTRLKILLILLGDRLCVCEIAESIELSIPATSQQLKILKQAGILARKNIGKTVYYSYRNDMTEKIIEKLLNIDLLSK